MKIKLLLSLVLIIPVFPLWAQSGVSERCEDIDLYYQWLQRELRDSIYYKAHLQYVADTPGKNRFRTLAALVKNKALWDEYRALAASGNSGSVEYLLSLAGRAARKHDPVMELEALDAAFTVAFGQMKDYDTAFYIGLRLREKLSRTDEADYPYKRETYYKLGEAYYLMHSYHKSIELLEKALSPSPAAFDDHINLDALNIMGICYANTGRMEISDECFRAALLSGDVVLNRPLYNAYALSHLGYNAMLTGRYDTALAISDVVWPLLRREGQNYGHLAEMCYCRGRSHLEKGNLRQTSVWIDSLVHFANRDPYNRIKRIKQVHQLCADYYTAIGDTHSAKMYYDSLVNVSEQDEENYISAYIARASLRFNDEKISDREAELQTNRIRLAVISIVAVCCFVVAAIILSLYREKNAAYKALAQKAELWARGGDKTGGAPDAANGKTDADGATDEDMNIMLLVEQQMTVHHAYREPGLTAESLAGHLGIHRNTLSRAVNRSTGHNFSSYINGFRIKEAVRIISESDRSSLYIGELYERVGFSNRSTFYRTFKLFTGISPVDFQKNKIAD